MKQSKSAHARHVMCQNKKAERGQKYHTVSNVLRWDAPWFLDSGRWWRRHLPRHRRLRSHSALPAPASSEASADVLANLLPRLVLIMLLDSGRSFRLRLHRLKGRNRPPAQSFKSKWTPFCGREDPMSSKKMGRSHARHAGRVIAIHADGVERRQKIRAWGLGMAGR